MSETWYAIVFNHDRPAGQAPDPAQTWKAGELYSTGTVVDQDKLPPWFDCVELDGPPGERTWNADARRRAIDRSSNDTG